MTKPGRYEHFKGKLYRVLLVATEATSEQRIVVYIPLYGNGELRWRTEQDFEAWVERGEYSGPRFYYVAD
jgi:hypothetical protein